MPLVLAKMHGAGNDFVVVATAPPDVPVDAAWVRRVADRRRGVGGDGVLFLERGDAADGAALRMHFYNADGTRAGLCLNGSRCVALRAVQLGWATDQVTIRTEHQQLQASVALDIGGSRAQVTLDLQAPRVLAREVELPVESRARLGTSSATVVDTGDPHLVVEVEAHVVEREDFTELARPLRHWQGSSPAGANVHFVHRAPGRWVIRSFERGVEDETLACGSGCVSSVGALSSIEARESYDLLTRSGEILRIRPGHERWTLLGPAELSFEAHWDDHA